jgi:hypothetical protein
MKKLIALVMVLTLSVAYSFSQEKKDNIKLGLLSAHEEDFEYLNGNVKEIHYKSYHLIEENGQYIKGKLYTFADSENTRIRQPISYYYDRDGLLVKTSATDDNGARWIGIIDWNNEQVDNVYFLKNDTLVGKNHFEYPSKQKIEMNWITIPENKVSGKTIYELDHKGNVLKITSYNQDEVFYTSQYLRNPDGTIKSMKGINKEGKVMWGRDKYVYNNKGLIETYHHNIFRGEEADMTSSNIEYQYDEKGNWIVMKHPKWMVVEREIAYY